MKISSILDSGGNHRETIKTVRDIHQFNGGNLNNVKIYLQRQLRDKTVKPVVLK